MSDQPTHPRAAGQTSSQLGNQPRPRPDLYAQITAKVVAMLEAGVVPWRSPILGGQSAGHPLNLASGRRYRGVNVFLLAFTAFQMGYESAYWLTFRQAKERGGTIKKGEKASMVVFWKPHEVTDKETGEVKQIYVLRYYHVFNVSQCADVPAPDVLETPEKSFTPVEAAEAIVSGYPNAPEIKHSGAKAFYRPKDDVVQIPKPGRFASPEEYYSTLFHELAHSTGHSSRLNRGLDTDLKPFGSPDYGKEELVAEMTAAFLCGHADITPSVIDNQAAYISGWLGVLKKDSRMLIAAGGAAQRAADHILAQPTGLRELGPEEHERAAQDADLGPTGSG